MTSWRHFFGERGDYSADGGIDVMFNNLRSGSQVLEIRYIEIPTVSD